MQYCEDEMLMLSGIQHFCFCRRQWALIHIFNQWNENSLTLEGRHIHRNVDDISKNKCRHNLIYLHGIYVSSLTLGLYGICDIVELTKCNDANSGVKFANLEGYWRIMPVEFKHGKAKIDNCDILQVCAQAICLEEANKIKIGRAAIYYGKTRHRMDVLLDQKLRDETYKCANEMHEAYNSQDCQKAKFGVKCKSCSLLEICNPQYELKKGGVLQYIQQKIHE